MKAVVVGAGLAGIAATWALQQHGYECILLESSDRIGGRMKTTTLGKHNIDEGFHVLHTAYPTLGRWLDINRLNLKPMDPATSLITPSSGRLQTLGDPLRASVDVTIFIHSRTMECSSDASLAIEIEEEGP